ncbi:unnamed protein product [Tenebrio molitor]|nr:unnamed protein product [Tenebrio molitor]
MCKQNKNSIGSTLLKCWKCVLCLECDRLGTMGICFKI